jgi:hypothetical protein
MATKNQVLSLQAVHDDKKNVIFITENSNSEDEQEEAVTSQDFIKFWGNFFAFVLYVLIENLQGFKTFWVYLKALLENYFKTAYYFQKDFFEKTKYQIIIFFLYSNLCKLACNGMNFKSIYKDLHFRNYD